MRPEKQESALTATGSERRRWLSSRWLSSRWLSSERQRAYRNPVRVSRPSRVSIRPRDPQSQAPSALGSRGRFAPAIAPPRYSTNESGGANSDAGANRARRRVHREAAARCAASACRRSSRVATPADDPYAESSTAARNRPSAAEATRLSSSSRGVRFDTAGTRRSTAVSTISRHAAKASPLRDTAANRERRRVARTIAGKNGMNTTSRTPSTRPTQSAVLVDSTGDSDDEPGVAVGVGVAVGAAGEPVGCSVGSSSGCSGSGSLDGSSGPAKTGTFPVPGVGSKRTQPMSSK